MNSTKLQNALFVICLFICSALTVTAATCTVVVTEANTWKNGDFNTVVSDSSINKYYRYNRGGNWKFEDDKQLVPKFWTVSSNAVGCCKKEGDNNYFIQLEKGYISQYYIGEGKGKLKISFRVRGKGTAVLWCCSYKDKPKGENGYALIKESEFTNQIKLTQEWTTLSVETNKLGVPTERVAIRFNAPQNGLLDLDDVCVTLVSEEK